MKLRPIQIVALTLTLALVVSACEGTAPTSTGVQLTAPTATPAPTSTPAPTATFTPVPSPTLPPTPTLTPTIPPLPPEPQRIEFQAEDGTKLVGLYYPAAVNPAPVVVMMHWAGGDKGDWMMLGMVQWLTHRGLPTDMVIFPPEVLAKLYPPMPEGLSFAAFVFDYRGYGESGGPKNQFLPKGWLMDSKAAVETAKTLPGVDPNRVAAIGASIGADGAVDGCIMGCVGALSLSPGSYLDVPYAGAVTALDKEGIPVYCFAADGDGEAAATCKSAKGDHYTMTIYPGRGHGYDLLQPDRDPDIGQTILDFFLKVFGL
ncbi:MAG: hypothetical protein HY872_14450 [Chloroflexi bacterium]|nr:hypothetical protein [Chloroflexota bacterium]